MVYHVMDQLDMLIGKKQEYDWTILIVYLEMNQSVVWYDQLL